MKGDMIYRSDAIEVYRKAKDKSEAHRMLTQLPPAQTEHGTEGLVKKRMVMIEMAKPERCIDCPIFRLHYDCGQCGIDKIHGGWVEPEDYGKVPEWCPLIEVEE